VLLLDEPLSNLDAKLRETVRVEIRELQHKLGITTVMVTHDQEEALIMADRLVVMSEGAVRQVGTQRELYERPADRFVAGFVGRSNLLAGKVIFPGKFQTDGGLGIVCPDCAAGPGVIALRPERLALGAAAAGLDNRLHGTVELVSYLGAMIDVHVRVSPADRVVVSQPNRADGAVPKEGDRIDVGWPRQAAAVFLDQP
jgi:putative spermidine/putrescine transport system ATP-binding protein